MCSSELYNWMGLDYSYFAGVAWANATAATELTGKELVADRLLMADGLLARRPGYPYAPGLWIYNHDGRGKWEVAPPATVPGVNELYGDGHVIWKKSSQFDVAAMTAANASGSSPPGFVQGYDSTYFY